MTVRDVLTAVGRRWYVFLAIMLAFGALTTAFYRDGGSFFTHTTVTFTLPARTTLEPDSGTTDVSVIAFAGAVATAMNEGKPAPVYSSADAPYYGAGVREGVMVSLRNNGNQWISSFPAATIDIQIVGHTREWVATRQKALLEEIMAVTRGQQSVAVISEQITASVGPLSTEIGEVTSSRSTQMLAVVAMGIAGLILGCSASVAVDRLARGRRNARHVVQPISRQLQTESPST
jgi:hypothetical protein